MTRREMVIAALQHKETEHVPYHADFTEQEYEKVAEYLNDKNFMDKYGTYLHYWQYWAFPTENPDRKGYFTDDFGVTWNRSGADKDRSTELIYIEFLLAEELMHVSRWCQ